MEDIKTKSRLKSSRVAVMFLLCICIFGFMISYTNRQQGPLHFVQETMQESVKRTNSSETMNKQLGHDSNTISDNRYPSMQKDRIDRIKQTCKNKELLSDNIYYGQDQPIYYYLRKYNFLYCKVPKSGSTFWTQAFNILKNDVSVSKDIFGLKRMKVHKTAYKFAVDYTNKKWSHVLSIITSRNPYSRLYSAFIDKSFLLLKMNSNIEIQKFKYKGETQCPINITFQDFLNYEIYKASQGRTLNRHWAPINSICRPCDVNAHILVKQESFSDDVETALRVFNVEQKKYDAITSGLRNHRIEATVPGIIKTVFVKSLKHLMNNCKTWIKVHSAGRLLTERLWESFKIQGFIRKSAIFPSIKFSKDSDYNGATVTRVILEYIKKHKLTSSEMKLQRHQALVDAYNSISPRTIEGIQKLYKIDFEMFGYSNKPSSL